MIIIPILSILRYMKHHLLLFFSVFFIVVASFTVSAAQTQPSKQEQPDEQFKKERRIFLWDVTISMVGATQDSSCPKAKKRSNPSYAYNQGYPNYNAKKDIFDKTREKLVEMIYQTQNESTELIVLPFRNGIVDIFRFDDATAASKENLKNQIMNWNDLQAGGTFTATCLKEAVNKYFTRDKINRLFLLTDGEPSSNEGSELINFLENWKGVKETKGPSSYLVYVMLTDEAYNEKIETIGKNSGGDITVTTSFEEPVWLSIGHSAEIHIRDIINGKNASKIGVPYSFVTGKEIPENSIFHFILEENDYIFIDPATQVKPIGGKLSVPFTLKMSLEDYLAQLPKDNSLILNATCEKDPESNKNIEITGSNTVEISLVIKSEPRVSISWSKKQ